MESAYDPRQIRQPPPRAIDWYTQAVLFFGSFIAQFGWVFGGFGMIFVWVFVPMGNLGSMFQRTSSWQVLTATIQDVQPTNMSENERLIYSNSFVYYVNGRVLEGSSYTVGNLFGPGQQAEVRVHPKKPERSVLAQGRMNPFSPWVLFVLLFPLVGLGMILAGAWTGMHQIHLLRDGTFTRGKFVSRDATGSTVTINNVTYPVYKYVFRFEHYGRAYQAVCKTHLTAPLEDEEREIILFDHLKPERNLVYDSMPFIPQVDAQGWLQPLPLRHAWVFIGPAVAIIINTIGVLLVF